MKIQVTVNNVIIEQKSMLNENEYNVHECEFEFTEEYNGLTKKAVFTGLDGKTYVQTIIDDKCNIPSEILQKRQTVKLGVYGYEVNNEELMLRYSPRPTQFSINEGSYKEGENTTPPTPSEVEQLQAQITSNKNDIEEIQGDVVDINQDIVDIKAEQITQNGNIQTNADNISTINGQIVTINADIDNLERTKADKTEIPTKTSDLINDSDFVSDRNYVHTDNNFTDTYKNQINQNTSDISSLNTNKADKTEIPTKTSQLTNDSGFITKNVNDLANYYKKSETYNKTEIDGKVSSVYKYKGTVATYQDLPSTDLIIGDVYNVEEDGSNYAWTGNSWDKLGGDIDLSEYYTKTQTDSLLSAKANSNEVYTKTETYDKAEVNTLLNGKVDKVEGKGLSTEDFTTAEKQKLASLENYDDTEVKADISELQESQTTQDSEIETLQQENEQLKQDVEDLRNNSLTVEGTGTDITLQNTAQARLLKNELSGRTEQEQLSGKNLANIKAISDTSIITIANDVITLKDNFNTGGYVNTQTKLSDLCPSLNVNETYILSFNTTSASSQKNIIYLIGVNEAWTKDTSKTITQEMLDSKVAVYGGYNETAVISEFMIRKSSETNTYEPYCGGIPAPNPIYKIPIKNVTGNANVKIQNKNLAWTGWAQDFVKRVNNTNSCNVVHNRYNRKNSLLYTPDIGYGDYDNKYLFKTNWKKNTRYTFSFDILKRLTTDKTFAIEYTDGSTTIIPNITNLEQWQHIVLVSDANKTIKYARVNNTGGVSYIDLDTFMVLEGAYTAETIPEYVEHQEQNLPFTFAEGQRAMKGTKLKDDGIHNSRARIIFDGSEDENWTRSNSLELFYTSDIQNLAKQNGNYLCNYFTKVAPTVTLQNGQTKYSSATNSLLQFKNTDITTVSAWREWLSTHNLIIEYELAESELENNIIPYNETQQEQYNNIPKARSYDDLIYFSSESDELGFNMDVESLRNIKSTIEDLDTRLKALEN